MSGDVTLGALKRLDTVLAGQDKDAVDINGGTIDGTAIGASTPSTGNFSTLKANGQTITGGIVALTATTPITAAAHAGRTCYITGTAAAAYTLPEATGTGDKYRFVMGQVNTNGTTIVTADTTNASYYGSVNILDLDAAAQAAYAAASTSDTITLNGTTKGGAIGDVIELIDIATDRWLVTGQLQCPTSSNPATPFSSAA